MKYASITVLALALLPSGVVIACASGSDSELFDGGGGASGASSTTGPASSSSGGVCISPCVTDLDCEKSCAPAGAGSNCCDVATGICFVANATICPAPVVDAGMDGMPPY